MCRTVHDCYARIARLGLFTGSHLGRVAIDDADVLRALGAEYDELLHVGADDVHGGLLTGLVYEIEELAHVSEELLGDALARGVDAEFHLCRAVDHRGSEHGDGYGLAEAARCGYQDLLAEIVPGVEFQEHLVRARECPRGVGFEEYPATRPNEVVVKNPLVIRPQPPRSVHDV